MVFFHALFCMPLFCGIFKMDKTVVFVLRYIGVEKHSSLFLLDSRSELHLGTKCGGGVLFSFIPIMLFSAK